MNYFPNNDEEISLIKFIARYQYLNTVDSQYFFESKRYYRNRVNNLIKKGFIRKSKLNLVLDKFGIEYIKLLNLKYNKLNRNKNYLQRLLYLSHLGAFYNKCELVNFIPSFEIKDKEVYTITSRKFIGVFEINRFDYLAYSVNERYTKKYVMSVIYDIQKEKEYKNIIILVDNISKINFIDFTFGLNEVLIIEDNEINLRKLKYLHSVNWCKIINDYYRNKLFLAEYNFCDYTDYKNIYLSCFYFLDTEKINRIKYFLRENENKTVDIICSNELKIQLIKELPKANYIVVELEKYIDKEIKYYD